MNNNLTMMKSIRGVPFRQYLTQGDQMNNIKLIPIDESNFLSAFNLQLHDFEKNFVSSPIRSLAQAYVYRDQCTPFGIYCDELMVGYVMVIYDNDEDTYNIWHMMIDKSYRGNGYGKAAIISVLDYIRNKPFGLSDTVLLTCSKNNAHAYTLYSNLGFKPTGNTDGDEDELCIKDRKRTRLNSSNIQKARRPSSAGKKKNTYTR